MFTGKLGTGQLLAAIKIAGGDDDGTPVINRTATSALVLDQDIVVVGPVTRSATDALVVADTAEVEQTGAIDVAASSVLTIDHAATFSGPVYALAESHISLNDAGNLAGTFDVSAGSTLTLDQSVARNGTIRLIATSSFTLTQFLDLTIKERAAVSTEVDLNLDHLATVERIRRIFQHLDLGDEASCNIFAGTASSVLTIGQIARYNPKIDLPATHIELADSADASIRPKGITSELIVDQVLHSTRPWHVAAVSELTEEATAIDLDVEVEGDVEVTLAAIESEASYTADRGRSAESVIPLVQSATRQHIQATAIDLVSESALSLDQDLVTHPDTDASDHVELDQLLVGHVAKPATSTLECGQSVVYEGTWSRSLANTLDVDQAVAIVVIRGNTACYSQIDLPTASELTGFRLLFPSTGTATDELVVRAPNLGNIDRLSMTRINRETRGGTLIVYADPIWPKVQTLVLSFSVLKRQEAQDLLTFMLSHLGQEIRMIDWENRGWKGVIVNPQDPIVEDRRNSFSASFEFEGARE